MPAFGKRRRLWLDACASGRKHTLRFALALVQVYTAGMHCVGIFAVIGAF
jgi:hypothetical protein